MKALIVFESMFGNTEGLARAVAEGLVAASAEVGVVEVRRVERRDLAGCELLVVAAPTHAFSLSRPQTRADAVTRGADPINAETGVREWLSTLDGTFDPTMSRPSVAVFDTRVEKVRHLPGSASRRAARMLTRQGFVLIGRPVSFYVEDVQGPISTGESQRARVWGQDLASAISEARSSSAPSG